MKVLVQAFEVFVCPDCGRVTKIPEYSTARRPPICDSLAHPEYKRDMILATTIPAGVLEVTG